MWCKLSSSHESQVCAKVVRFYCVLVRQSLERARRWITTGEDDEPRLTLNATCVGTIRRIVVDQRHVASTLCALPDAFDLHDRFAKQVNVYWDLYMGRHLESISRNLATLADDVPTQNADVREVEDQLLAAITSLRRMAEYAKSVSDNVDENELPHDLRTFLSECQRLADSSQTESADAFAEWDGITDFAVTRRDMEIITGKRKRTLDGYFQAKDGPHKDTPRPKFLRHNKTPVYSLKEFSVYWEATHGTRIEKIPRGLTPLADDADA